MIDRSKAISKPTRYFVVHKRRCIIAKDKKLCTLLCYYLPSKIKSLISRNTRLSIVSSLLRRNLRIPQDFLVGSCSADELRTAPA